MDALVDSSPEAQIKAQVVKICSKGKKSVILKKDDYYSIIEELKVTIAAETKTPRHTAEENVHLL